MIGEFSYYRLVGEWLRSQGYDIGEGLELPRDGYEERGAPFRFDKAGVKNLGTKKIKIAAIEIKNQEIADRTIKQAIRYYTFSHKAYVASPYKPTKKIADKIEKSGLGFLLINPKEKKIKEVIKPLYNTPKEDKMIYWLNEYFKIYRCRICSNFVRKDKAKENSFKDKKISENHYEITVVCKNCKK